MNDNNFLNGYENTTLLDYKESTENFPNKVLYDDLPDHELSGVLKANWYENGKLMQSYSDHESHVGIIAATRLGKSTSYVVPTIRSFSRAKKKR